jgi:DNA-directed RNA polymerase subunit RPC12/RpoP
MLPDDIYRCGRCGGQVRQSERTFQGEYIVLECMGCGRQSLIYR